MFINVCSARIFELSSLDAHPHDTESSSGNSAGEVRTNECMYHINGTFHSPSMRPFSSNQRYLGVKQGSIGIYLTILKSTSSSTSSLNENESQIHFWFSWQSVISRAHAKDCLFHGSLHGASLLDYLSAIIGLELLNFFDICDKFEQCTSKPTFNLYVKIRVLY